MSALRVFTSKEFWNVLWVPASVILSPTPHVKRLKLGKKKKAQQRCDVCLWKMQEIVCVCVPLWVGGVSQS